MLSHPILYTYNIVIPFKEAKCLNIRMVIFVSIDNHLVRFCEHAGLCIDCSTSCELSAGKGF